MLQYLSFFPILLKGDFWTRSANIPALLLVLESYIRSYPQQVFSDEYLSQVLGCFQHLINSKPKDQHGFRLAAAMLPYVDTFDKFTSRELLLPMLNRMNQAKTTKFSRAFVLFICRYAIVKGGAQLATALESIQAGIYLMVVERIILAEMKQMPQTTTYEEKRIVTIGVAALVTDTVAVLGSFYSQLVDCSVAILESFENKEVVADVDEDQYVETNELEYSDPYCKLSYAQHPDVVGRDITNVRLHLAQSVLIRAAASSAQSVDCLTARSRNFLQSYLTSSS